MEQTINLMRRAAVAAALLAPTVALSQDWTGPSVGLQFGNLDAETSGPSLSGDDVFIGARGYYDVDFGDFIVGGGLQYDTADIDLGGVTSIDSVLRLGARAGADLGQAYVYGTGGYARVHTSDAAVGDSNGYFLGAGLEYLVAEDISLGGEVLYHQFRDFDLGGLEAEATTVGVSLNFRF